ncbi:hypothetical protein RPMA_18440 [Tardiphaga alba]|uniref:YdaS antitoxin of YdaST toxin-antitoxin system n=1 Tax=Tardiphaga alba TaxID=340268 RepID=A0ABX8ABC5_9BRAD|nr:hypothetical protein [Tardiphaga alba]QUS40596.1 hypothetical protein RPMA_18440 [Tardiphaga alba]
MNTIDEVFAAFSGTSAFAAALGLNLSTASEMRRRSSIPVRYWPKLVDAARERAIDGITFDTLVAMHVPAPETQNPMFSEQVNS